LNNIRHSLSSADTPIPICDAGFQKAEAFGYAEE
jgi:hypothetical protein